MLKLHIIRSISQMFFPFFFVLFFISSIILIVSIATITANIKISLSDLFVLFYYGIPSSIFFVIAITFFSACVMGINKLSYDSEMLVLFSLGISPKSVVLILLPLCMMASVVLLMFSFVMTPLSKNAYKNFLKYKSSTVDININPGDFGQRIGDWLIYADGKTQNKYEGLVLYSSKGNVGQNFIIANSGEVANKNGVLEMILHDGNAYFDDEKELKKIRFKDIVMRNYLDQPSFKSYDLYGYWMMAFEGNRAQQRRFSQALVTSLFPIASIFFIPFLGIKNPRFHKNRVYLLVFSSVGIYLSIMYSASMDVPFLGLLLPPVWFFTGLYLYKRYVSKVY